MLWSLNYDYLNFIFISINTKLALAAHVDFSSFSSWPFFQALCCYLFYTQVVFELDIIFIIILPKC